MAKVTVVWTLEQAQEVRRVLTESVERRGTVLQDVHLRREKQGTAEGRAELERSKEQYALLEAALRALA